VVTAELSLYTGNHCLRHDGTRVAGEKIAHTNYTASRDTNMHNTINKYKSITKLIVAVKEKLN
jgi:hypothetical protein